MSEPVIRVEHASKRFARTSRVRTLAELVLHAPRRWAQRRNDDGLLPHEFFALRDLSFEVRPGEMLGILGPNGAGKSTVLKLLYRILRPDAGRVHTQGRIGGLIELGAGFHPYLTGRENVGINGAILGMSRAEIRQRYDAIVEFAGMAEFMDMPVKDYSSGMYARLAFAIAAHAEPDILLVDEVLAVGDASFQLKCYDWMARMRRSGRAIVNVSHDMGVMGACTRCLCLNQGRVAHEGEPREVIQSYLALMQQSGTTRAAEAGTVPMADGRARVELTALEVLDTHGTQATEFLPGADVVFRFGYRANDAIRAPIFGITLYHDDLRIPVSIPRHYLFHAWSGGRFADATLHGAGVAEVRVHDLRLPVGAYRAKAYIYEGDAATPVLAVDGAAKLEVMRAEGSDGRALIDHSQDWHLREAGTP